MKLLIRTLERLFIALVGLVVIWFIVTQIFDRLDQRMSLFTAAAFTYLITAYLVLPRVIHFIVMILRRGRIPRFTRTTDRLSADPINIVLIGSEEQLTEAFATARWYQAERLTIHSGWKMVRAFVENKTYLTAPFSSLYLFGRRQDHGFQQAIGKSPRQRHHIRFWAANINPQAHFNDFRYWMSKHPIDPSKPIMWVGAGTKDTGLGLTRLTYQISHATDKNVDEEREYILSSLRQAGWLTKEQYFASGEFVKSTYVSDGRILVAYLEKGKTKIGQARPESN